MSLPALLDLAHQLGRPDLQLAILGEGNVSWRCDEDTFAVKASGSNLETLTREGVTVCHFAPFLELLNRKGRVRDEEIDHVLMAARVDPNARRPSVEAMFHAWLLTLPGVQFVGHTHPCAVNGLLCSTTAQTFAARRLFPDEIVCCGRSSAFVPYSDPGLVLAQRIKASVIKFRKTETEDPRVILLQNHGLIAIGATPAAVIAATLMAEKSATVYARVMAVGRPRFLTQAQVERIANRADEHHRRKQLGI